MWSGDSITKPVIVWAGLIGGALVYNGLAARHGHPMLCHAVRANRWVSIPVAAYLISHIFFENLIPARYDPLSRLGNLVPRKIAPTASIA